MASKKQLCENFSVNVVTIQTKLLGFSHSNFKSTSFRTTISILARIVLLSVLFTFSVKNEMINANKKKHGGVKLFLTILSSSSMALNYIVYIVMANLVQTNSLSFMRRKSRDELLKINLESIVLSICLFAYYIFDVLYSGQDYLQKITSHGVMYAGHHVIAVYCVSIHDCLRSVKRELNLFNTDLENIEKMLKAREIDLKVLDLFIKRQKVHLEVVETVNKMGGLQLLTTFLAIFVYIVRSIQSVYNETESTNNLPVWYICAKLWICALCTVRKIMKE